jgi:hypothetical protein
MSWIKNRLLILALGFALPAFGLTISASAGPIVIKYSGPAVQIYKPGTKLSVNGTVKLSSGEVLTVLDERGTRVLRGPGVFSTSSSTSAGKIASSSLAKIAKTSNVRRARTGAVRGSSSGDPTTRSPNLWFVDISKGGTTCVADFAQLQFWRSDNSALFILAAQDAKTGTKASVTFRKGQSTAAWPSEVAPVDGGSYLIGSGASKDMLPINLVRMPFSGDEQIDLLAEGLLAKGCQSQSELLAETFVQ